MPVATDLTDVKRDFDLQGYAHLTGVFNAGRISELQDKLDRFLVDTLPGVPDQAVNAGRDGDVIQVKALNKYNAEFDALLHDPDLSSLAAGLLGRPVSPTWVHYRNAPCQTDDEVFPHQDAQGLNLHPCHAVTFWMPLGPCGPESGCLRYVPGSHWRGFQAIQYSSSSIARYCSHEVEFTVDAGDVLAHHCMTIHRSAPNATPHRRPALMFFFKDAAAQAIDGDAWIARYGSRRMAG